MIIVATAMLAGCSFVDDNLMPVLTGEEPSEQTASGSQPSGYPPPQQIPPSPAESNPQPTLSPVPAPPPVSSGNYNAGPVTPGASTGTYVGQKVAGLRADLQRLQSNINQHNGELQQARQQMAQDASNYYNLVASVNSRLQVGTTPGNPQLQAQWNSAQAALTRLSDDITRLNTISNAAASDSALAAYILESVRAAYGLQGAVEEDHRQLATLENDCNRTVVLIDRLLNDISEDISRQSNYVSNERRNLTMLSLAIKNGELYGQSLSNRAYSGAAPQQVASAGARGDRRPLMVIRFDRTNVAYEQALYTAVSRALERRPGAVFDVVAVAPSSGTPGQVALNTTTAKRNADGVVRSLTNMGLPAERINLSSTTSSSAQTSEVQIYVR
ncbi:MAG TPA: hypothetical protein VMU06_11385 [Stellaceae bacterium]|nr:hypothetical protein [Stellaceae bacterium]